MNAFIALVICAVSIIFLTEDPSPRDWRGLRPLHSTCDDVNRALGVTQGLTKEQEGDVGFLKMDAYGNISTPEESKRLDEFVTHLKTQPPIQAYIVAYGGRKSWPGEANYRANCVKQYLVKKHKIAERWITTIDGGYQDEAIVELYISLTGDPPITSPTLDRKDVQIIKDRRMSRQGKCRLTSRVPKAHSVQPRTLRKSH